MAKTGQVNASYYLSPTNSEQERIEIYGFSVKEIIGKHQFIEIVGFRVLPNILTLFGLFLIFSPFFLSGYSSVFYLGLIVYVGLFMGICGIYLSYFLYKYLIHKNILLLNGKYNVLYKNTFYTGIREIKETKILQSMHIEGGDQAYYEYLKSNNLTYIFFVIYSLIYRSLGYMLLSIGSTFELFMPFNNFINLFSNIQALTIRLRNKSMELRKIFNDTISIQNGFEELSLLYTKIVSQVVKIEQEESKINKGDLFDSTKYINSLREDIRTPLLSLKNFLEKKKVELGSSQKELMRVQVSVGGEGENRELQSMRSEGLLKELDESIARLDEMIGKL